MVVSYSIADSVVMVASVFITVSVCAHAESVHAKPVNRIAMIAKKYLRVVFMCVIFAKVQKKYIGNTLYGKK